MLCYSEIGTCVPVAVRLSVLAWMILTTQIWTDSQCSVQEDISQS